MDKKNVVLNLLKNNNLEGLKRINKNTVLNTILDILDEDLDKIDYEEDITYLKNIVKVLPYYISTNKKHTYNKTISIHQKIKTKLVQKPGKINKTSKVYKDLKKMINNIEVLQMSILYDCAEKYNHSKYELLEYIIFNLKNASFLDTALKKFPHLINYKDENDIHIFINILNKYIDEIMKYSESRGIDTILYYDEIINLFLRSDKLMVDIIDKQIILKRIKECLIKQKTHKHRKNFYLNTLFLELEGKEINNTLDNLEYKYKIKKEFDESVNTELRIKLDNYDTSKDRTVIDDKIILSFDGEDAEEIDDALSVERLENGNILLGVHIASPLSIINENDIIFDEASDRTSSIYLSDQAYSMFPKELSKDLISLKSGNYRNAITYYFEIDRFGNVINQKYLKSLIKVTKNMTYKEFDERLRFNDTKIDKTINLLSLTSNYLQRYYNEDPLYNAVNRQNSNFSNTNIVGLSNGGKVIESAMIFTNYMVSKYFKDNNLPFIYRNHIIDEDSKQKLEEIKINLNEYNYSKYIDVINNIYPKAYYDLNNQGHEGLGLSNYCHITSPLRRFADIIATLCLEKFYFNKYDENDIEQTKILILKNSSKINKKRNSIEKFSKEYENLTR